MKHHTMLILGAVLSVALTASTYAGQGQTGFGGVSGEASTDDLDMKSDAAPPASSVVTPKTNVQPTTSPTPKSPSDSKPSVSKKKSKRTAKTSDTKVAVKPVSATPSTNGPRKSSLSSGSTMKSGPPASNRTQSASASRKTTAASATSADRTVKPIASGKPAATASMPPSIPLGAATVEGEVLRITGDSYIVKDVSGKNVRLQVDKDTKVGGNISAHDMVEVHASEVSNAKSPKAAWHADSIEKR